MNVSSFDLQIISVATEQSLCTLVCLNQQFPVFFPFLPALLFYSDINGCKIEQLGLSLIRDKKSKAYTRETDTVGHVPRVA